MRNNLIVEFEKSKQEVQFEAPIKGISIDGEKLSDVHELTQRVVGMTKTIKLLVYTALTLCVMSVSVALFVIHWLLSHDSSIDTLLLTTNKNYSQKVDDALKWNSHDRVRAYIHLKDFYGLYWDDGMKDWLRVVDRKGNR